MIKKILFVCLICCYGYGYSSNDSIKKVNDTVKLYDIFPLNNGLVIYSDVILIDNIDKNTLYNNAKKWFVDYYNSAKDVIQLDDKDNGNIIGDGLFNVEYISGTCRVKYNISIFVKDGRYKYEIKNLIFLVNTRRYSIDDFPKTFFGKKKLFNNINNEVNLIIESIKKSMKTITNDW